MKLLSTILLCIFVTIEPVLAQRGQRHWNDQPDVRSRGLKSTKGPKKSKQTKGPSKKSKGSKKSKSKQTKVPSPPTPIPPPQPTQFPTPTPPKKSSQAPLKRCNKLPLEKVCNRFPGCFWYEENKNCVRCSRLRKRALCIAASPSCAWDFHTSDCY